MSTAEVITLSVLGGGASYCYFKYIHPSPTHITLLQISKDKINTISNWLNPEPVLEPELAERLLIEPVNKTVDGLGALVKVTGIGEIVEEECGSLIGRLTSTAFFKWLYNSRREVILSIYGTIFTYCILKSCQHSWNSRTTTVNVVFEKPVKDVVAVLCRKINTLFEEKNRRGVVLMVGSTAFVVAIKAFEIWVDALKN